MSEQQQHADPLRIACELVGRFQYHFSKIEAAMDLGIAKVLDLKNANTKDIVCANLDFVKKVNIIKAAGQIQFPNDKDEIFKVLKRAVKINNPHRQNIIHSTFEPIKNGVRFLRTTAKQGKLKRQTDDWDDKRFAQMFGRMDDLAKELEALVAKLKYEPRLDFSDSRNSQYLILGF